MIKNRSKTQTKEDNNTTQPNTTHTTQLNSTPGGSFSTGSLLGRSWRVLSPPDRLLGRSWRGLGAFGHLLGRLGGNPKQHKNNTQKNMQKGGLPPHFWEEFGRPKSTQDGTQNESKFEMIFKTEKVALQEPLGAVLGRS